MYAVIVGGGVVGYNVLRALTGLGYESVLIEREKHRFAQLEAEYEHMIVHGDGTEITVLESAGVRRANLVIAVTGKDDDNIVIAQLAKELFETGKVIARVNDPRNQE